MTQEIHQMHKQARDMAIKHGIGLGRMSNGHYYIAEGERRVAISMYPTCASAIVMMRKAVSR